MSASSMNGTTHIKLDGPIGSTKGDKSLSESSSGSGRHRKTPAGILSWGVSAIILLTVGILGGMLLGGDSEPILTYQWIGNRSLDRSVYFYPETAAPGDVVQLHFDRVYWYTTKYRSELIFNVSCLVEVERNGDKIAEPQRIDFPPYPISTPKDIGPVDPKWRPFRVPAECLPGRLVYRAFARHYTGDLSSRETPVPEVYMMVSGK